MSETKKVLIQIDLSSEEAEKRLLSLRDASAKLRGETKSLEGQIKALAAAGDTSSDTYKELQTELVRTQAALKANNQEQKVYERILVQSRVAANAQVGSLAQMRARLSELTAQYAGFGSELKESSEDARKVAAEIATLTAELKKQESALGDNRRNVGNYKDALDGVPDTLKNIAGALGLAFSVDAVISFADESVKAFQEAELNARRLQAAVSATGGLQSDFDNLIAQSATIQGTTIFSDDDVQTAQTAALQYGLTADRVQELIPVVADFASATGQELGPALESVLRGAEGSDKALKLYGIQLEDGANRADQLNNIIRQLNGSFEGQAKAVAETAAGALKQYQNQVDDLQESVGERLSPALQTLKVGLLAIVNDLSGLFTGELPDGLAKGSGLEEITRLTDLYSRSVNKLSGTELKRLSDEVQRNVQVLQALRDGQKLGSEDWQSYSDQINMALAILRAYNQEAKRRQSPAPSKAEEDLTKLTTAQLKERLDNLRESNALEDRDRADVVEKEIKRREDLAAKTKASWDKEVSAAKSALDKLKGIASQQSEALLKARGSSPELLDAQKQREIDSVEETFKAVGSVYAAGTQQYIAAAEFRGQALDAIDEKYRLLKDQGDKAALDKSLDEVDKITQQLIGENEAALNQELQQKAEANALKREFLQSDYDAQLEQLDAYYQQVISNTQLSEQERNDIIEKLNQQRLDIQDDQVNSELQVITGFFSSIGGLMKKGAIEQQAINSFVTLIDTYLSAQLAYKTTTATLGPIAGAIAAATATIQGLARVAAINNAKFYEGGYTGDGDPRSESLAVGPKPYIYHKREYVVPHQVLESPTGRVLVNQLEQMRLKGPAYTATSTGYARGGFADVVAPSPNQGRVVTNVVGVSASEVRQIVQDTVSAMPAPIVTVEDINAGQASVAVVEARARI